MRALGYERNRETGFWELSGWPSYRDDWLDMRHTEIAMELGAEAVKHGMAKVARAFKRAA